MLKKIFCPLIFCLFLIYCGKSAASPESTNFTISELADVIVDVQGLQIAENIPILNILDKNVVESILKKSINIDKYIPVSITPMNLISALQMTYEPVKTQDQSQITRAYYKAIKAAYDFGYFRIAMVKKPPQVKEEDTDDLPDPIQQP